MNTLYISDKFVILMSIILTSWFIFSLRCKIWDKLESKFAFGMYCNFMTNLYLLYCLQNFFLTEHVLMGVMILFSIITMIILKKLNLYQEKHKIYFIMVIILAVGLGYAMYTPYYARQHDSRDFINYQNGGHFGYIGYIFFENSLPKGSPVDQWCFYNPPLFHIVSALFLKIQNLIQGLSVHAVFENLQMMSLLYAMIFHIYVYRILKEMNIQKSIVYLLAFVGLSPAMIIMSGSINNDMLSIMLSTMAIFYTIRWYKEDNLKNLIKIAFSISLAMMTKISAALTAVPIAFVFLVKVLQNKQQLKKYVGNFVIFALIALPIGLWFPVKNLILYDIPLTYVQSVDESNGANVSRFTISERLFKISKENLETVNVVMGGEKIDYNLFLTTIKSFIVDENMDYQDNPVMKVSIYTIFVSAILLTILFIINVIYLMKNYKMIKQINQNWLIWLIFFAGIFVLTAASYIKFCFDFPFTFTMNFRYIVPTLVSYAVLTGTVCEKNKKLLYSNCSVITVFCIASIVLFMNLL